MLNIDILTFNLFEEKTYIVSQGNGYCVIVDPGCSNEAERQTLIKALTDKSLTPTAVLLTHGHLDHVYGAAFIQKTYRDIPVYLNPADIKVMELTGAMAQKFHMEAPEIGFKTTDIHDSDTL
ncbi:MAG: MBL fold metallo-hydrolase, partial [Alistipes sp.]|nr:MBL fold metallo-hydrolase [Alistipes sp.]